MANTDQVRRLINSHRRGDERAFDAAAHDAVTQAEAGDQDTLALELESLMLARKSSRTRPVTVGTLRPLPLGRDELPLISLSDPTVTFDDLVLPDPLLTLLRQIVREHRHRDLLAARGLVPRRRLLFTGPSGTGKSRTAEAMAAELGVPVAKVRLATVVSSYLGETSRHLEQILDFAAHGSWILVFDEIDMLGAERDRNDHGEMRRVVASFLQTIEETHVDSLIIATTNHPGALDSALWRRFDEVAVFKPPTRQQAEALLLVKLRKMATKVNRSAVASLLKGLSQAEIESICNDAMRSVTLSGHETVTTADLLASATERRKRQVEAGRFLT